MAKLSPLLVPFRAHPTEDPFWISLHSLPPALFGPWSLPTARALSVSASALTIGLSHVCILPSFAFCFFRVTPLFSLSLISCVLLSNIYRHAHFNSRMSSVVSACWIGIDWRELLPFSSCSCSIPVPSFPSYRTVRAGRLDGPRFGGVILRVWICCGENEANEKTNGNQKKGIEPQ